MKINGEDSYRTEIEDSLQNWSKYAKVYDPIKCASIDGTDTEPHDRAVVRALNSSYKPNRFVKGRPECTIFVSRLNHETSKETIKEIFSKYGRLKRFRMVKDIVTGMPKGYAFVEYEEEHSAEEAYRLANKQVVDGNIIFVDFECERLLKGWKPRRFGGGFCGKKESGQLRFGGRDRPFKKPITLELQEKEEKKLREKQKRREEEQRHRRDKSREIRKRPPPENDRNSPIKERPRQDSPVRVKNKQPLPTREKETHRSPSRKTTKLNSPLRETRKHESPSRENNKPRSPQIEKTNKYSPQGNVVKSHSPLRGKTKHKSPSNENVKYSTSRKKTPDSSPIQKSSKRRSSPADKARHDSPPKKVARVQPPLRDHLRRHSPTRNDMKHPSPPRESFKDPSVQHDNMECYSPSRGENARQRYHSPIREKNIRHYSPEQRNYKPSSFRGTDRRPSPLRNDQIISSGPSTEHFPRGVRFRSPIREEVKHNSPRRNDRYVPAFRDSDRQYYPPREKNRYYSPVRENFRRSVSPHMKRSRSISPSREIKRYSPSREYEIKRYSPSREYQPFSSSREIIHHSPTHSNARNYPIQHEDLGHSSHYSEIPRANHFPPMREDTRPFSPPRGNLRQIPHYQDKFGDVSPLREDSKYFPPLHENERQYFHAKENANHYLSNSEPGTYNHFTHERNTANFPPEHNSTLLSHPRGNTNWRMNTQERGRRFPSRRGKFRGGFKRY